MGGGGLYYKYEGLVPLVPSAKLERGVCRTTDLEIESVEGAVCGQEGSEQGIMP